MFPGMPGGARSHNLFFHHRRRNPLSRCNVGRSFEKSIARAGVPKVGLHDLRHCDASLDLSTGTSVKAVAARLGHSDPSIMLRTYAHVMPNEETAAAERLGALLSTQATLVFQHCHR